MSCNSCAQRRNLTAQAMNNIRRGDAAAAKQNAQAFVKTVRQDVGAAARAIRSTIMQRPRPR